MNRKKLQSEVCKALLDGSNRCYCCKLNEKEIAVTINGYDVFVFDIKECVFDISKITEHKTLLEVCNEKDSDARIIKGNQLFQDGRRTIQRYKEVRGKFDVYADTCITKKFDDSDFVMLASHSLDRVLVKDRFGRIVGAFLPVNFKRKDEFNE